MELVIWCLGAYLLGAVPSGVVVARIMGGRDPRSAGSGNIGATNVGRVLGKKAGIITLLADAAKGFIPVFAASRMGGDATLMALVGFSAFFGHLFPVYLKFKGGKGVATGAGVFLAICPLALAASAAVFALLLATSRMVSLGSVVSASSLPLAAFYATPEEARIPVVSLALAVAFFTVIKHRANIGRIISGTESKLGQRA